MMMMMMSDGQFQRTSIESFKSILLMFEAWFCFQDPFDVDEFVERLAWRSTGGTRNVENFDPLLLHAAFEKTIRDLKEMNVSVMKQVEQLETECNDEEKAHWQRVAKLHEHNQVHYVQLQISFHAKFRLVAVGVVRAGNSLFCQLFKH